MWFFTVLNLLTNQFYQNEDFWKQASIYATKNNDKSFVNEMAYVMVTLHRTGS